MISNLLNGLLKKSSQELTDLTLEVTEQSNRLIGNLPLEQNAFQLQKGAWKYNYDKLSMEEIINNVKSDGRPKFCADTFPGFKDYKILELGPCDGYNTVGLELQGAYNIISIEGNSDAFMRCLIMKNAYNLKAKFLLGDFLKFISNDVSFDLIYASGVLYHLVDPMKFLCRCGEISPNIFIWSFYYDDNIINNHDYEKSRFKSEDNIEFNINGEAFTYYRRYYEISTFADKRYAGGLQQYANWLSRDDLFKAMNLAGYRIIKVIEDAYSGIPALNILASKKT